MFLKDQDYFRKIKSVFYALWKKTRIFFVGLFGKLKKYFRMLFKNIVMLFTVFKKWEKIILISLLVIIIFSASGLYYRSYLNKTTIVPDFGGTYIEGILGDNKSAIDQVVQKLTKIGLTYFDYDGILQPAIAEKWEISEDGKIYTFYLRGGIDSKNISEVVKSYKNSWSEIQVETPETDIIKFILKEPYSPFLASTSEPMFEYGPYKLKNQDKSEIIFESNNDFIMEKPYLKEIILKIYPDEDNLVKAFYQDKIMGFSETPDGEFKGLTAYSMSLPRYMVAFLNLNREIFQDKIIRQKIKNSEHLDNEKSAVLVTSNKETNLAKAEELKEKWGGLGLKIEIQSYDPTDLQKEIIPKRNYDILLYGIDYGYDKDPYPFWHSSQMSGSGLNLSNFSNQKADTYLEEGRQTIDENARLEKYQKFQEIINEETPAIIFEQQIWKYSASVKVIGTKDHAGVTPSDRYNEVWKWYIKTKRVKN